TAPEGAISLTKPLQMPQFTISDGFVKIAEGVVVLNPDDDQNTDLIKNVQVEMTDKYRELTNEMERLAANVEKRLQKIGKIVEVRDEDDDEGDGASHTSERSEDRDSESGSAAPHIPKQDQPKPVKIEGPVPGSINNGVTDNRAQAQFTASGVLTFQSLETGTFGEMTCSTTPGPLTMNQPVSPNISTEGPEVTYSVQPMTGPMTRSRTALTYSSTNPLLMTPQNFTTPSGKGPILLNMPLVAGDGGQIYRPWSHSDMNAIMSKLPPITGGGGLWLSKVLALSHGIKLAMGDIRCLLGQILTVSQMRAVEEEAGTERTPNEVEFATCSTHVGKALRVLYPIPATVYQNLKFKIKPGETGAAYLHRCSAEWEQSVEEHSSVNKATENLFREAVLAGAPQGVQ
ncbi:MAG: hypothetical protein ACRC0X_04475, partial [Brevinema sp.]